MKEVAFITTKGNKALIKRHDELKMMLPIEEFAENGKVKLPLVINN